MSEPVCPPFPSPESFRAKPIELTDRGAICLFDFEPTTDSFRQDVVEGLRQTTKAIPSKYFYDERGLALFKKITRLPAYYLTRAELAILRDHGEAIAQRLGPECLLLEYGGGDSTKAKLLLEHLPAPAGYVPIDISRDHLLEAAISVASDHPSLRVCAIRADYTRLRELPAMPNRRTVVYFPGSTIGNLTPSESESFLHTISELVGDGGCLLIGVDLKKDRDVLELAYNDPEGVTAAFNKNMLVRINRELGGTFDLEAFAHRATYNQALGRIEMHLVSRWQQDVHVGKRTFTFQQGETIHTENSYKYDLEGFASIAESAGFEVDQVWTDTDQFFSLQLLQATKKHRESA